MCVETVQFGELIVFSKGATRPSQGREGLRASKGINIPTQISR